MLQGMNILYENNSLVHYYFPIVQWGTVKGVANGKQYNFPISFINNILGAATNKNWRGGYGSADGNSAGIELINKTSFYAYGDDGSPNVNYIVIGY